MDLSIEMYGYIFNLSDVVYEKVEGSYSYNAPSDMDYYGWEDVEYKVKSIFDTETGLDLKGVDYTEVLEEQSYELESRVKLHFNTRDDD